MKYTDEDKAVLLLTTRIGHKEAPSIPPGMWWEIARLLREERKGPAHLLADPGPVGIKSDAVQRITELRALGTSFGFALESLTNRGIHPIPYTSEDFPASLQRKLLDRCPPVLFVAGDPSAFELGGLGIVGSRDVSVETAEVARNTAARAAEEGIAVISGGARGVDQLSMRSAAEVGGRVVAFLADSLSRVVREPEARQLVLDGRLTLASAQHPDSGFSAGAAMSRNKLIYAASDATFVVSSALGSGGTWTGAMEALRRSFCPVLVWTGDGAGPGNEDLVRAGARRVEDVDAIFEGWPPSLAENVIQPTQAELFPIV